MSNRFKPENYKSSPHLIEKAGPFLVSWCFLTFPIKVLHIIASRMPRARSLLEMQIYLPEMQKQRRSAPLRHPTRFNIHKVDSGRCSC